jgi:acyl-CoA thioesterase I
MKTFLLKLGAVAGLIGLALLPLNAVAAGVVLVMGDSLSSAYGIGQKEGWVTLLQERLRKNGLDYTVVNESIPGETTAGGASRIKAVVQKSKPTVAIIALGGNDGLRGLPIKQMREHLSQMVSTVKSSGGKVLLVGMKMPPNYGPSYTRDFETAFAEVAKQQKIASVPFMLEGVGERRELFQADNIHPTAEAQPAILDTVWRRLRPML